MTPTRIYPLLALIAVATSSLSFGSLSVPALLQARNCWSKRHERQGLAGCEQAARLEHAIALHAEAERADRR